MLFCWVWLWHNLKWIKRYSYSTVYRIPAPWFIKKRASGSGRYQNPKLWKNPETDWKSWNWTDYYCSRKTRIAEKTEDAGCYSEKFHCSTWHSICRKSKSFTTINNYKGNKQYFETGRWSIRSIKSIVKYYGEARTACPVISRSGQIGSEASGIIINSSAIIYSIAETAKANNLKPFNYFEYLLAEIPKHVDDKNTDFLAELLPWSDMLHENIRKPQKASGK